MRAQGKFSYVIECLPTHLPIFDFIQEHGPVTDEEAYGNLNMGAGFALYVPERDVEKALDVIDFSNSFKSFRAGYIETSDTKRVVIRPKNLEYSEDSLAVR